MDDVEFNVLSETLKKYMTNSDQTSRSLFIEHILRGLDLDYVDFLRSSCKVHGLQDMQKVCIGEIVSRSKFYTVYDTLKIK